jgi:RimJ/RimL family protein N-acetyltransferase
MKTILKTERLQLREWTPEDAEALLALVSDAEVMRFIGDGSVLERTTSDALLARIEREWVERGFGLWAVEEHGSLLGFCGLSVPMFLPEVLPAVEVGWRLSRAVWGRGIATEVARAAMAFGFERCGMAEIVSIVDPRNERSLRVCEKLGMTPRADRIHPVTRRRLRVLARRSPPSPAG